MSAAADTGSAAAGDAAFRIEHDPPIARLVLSAAKRRNPLSLATMQGLTDLFRQIDGEAGAGTGAGAETRVIVIEAEGPAFSAGHDISEMADQSQDFYEQLIGQCCQLMQAVRAAPQPVIAKVDGIATAAGCQLVAACDLAVASYRSRFATPGVEIGLFCSTPMVPLSRAVGAKRAMQMLLTAQPISASRARDWGLINEVVPAVELDAAVARLAGQICQFSPEVIALGKQAFYSQIGLNERQAYGLASEAMVENAQWDVAQEGFSAFLEKRQPAWKRPLD